MMVKIWLSSWGSIKIVGNSKVDSWKIGIIAFAEETRAMKRPDTRYKMTNTRIGETTS